MNAKFQRTARRDKKAFLSDQCKEIEGNNRMRKAIEETIEWERLEISSRKLEISMEHFMQNGLNKGQKWDKEAEDIKKRWQEYTEEVYKKRSS